ncbi:MAG: biotin carboxylase N-terminal domain-containing protein, partial [Vulcanimicrobiaceae bacterium]
MSTEPPARVHRLLVANRGEIAIRVLRAATELGLATVAIYSQEDRFALHRFKADQSFLVGAGRSPVAAYLDIEGIVAIARDAGADAIHPGYGFLAENPEFAEAVRAAGIVFVGPRAQTMRLLGDKVAAREQARAAGVPILAATEPLPSDPAAAAAIVAALGYPAILKASWGGGGRGMRIVRDPDGLREALPVARREALAAFGNDALFAERYVARARHVEVQLLGDRAGNVVQLGERDCSVQRRHQKVVEESPARALEPALRAALLDAALRIFRAVGYENAGTAEFLIDTPSGEFAFIEANPRIQVEHTVTELVTGIDIVKAQIRLAEGALLGSAESGVPPQSEIALRGSALQCRITTENPQADFLPTFGAITAYRPATGFGVRLDGTGFAGATILPFYDSLLEKVTVWAPTFEEARLRMLRALREFRVRGVTTNVSFLDALLSSPQFRVGPLPTSYLDESLAQLVFPQRRDRATRLLAFIGETIVNGNAEVRGRPPAEVRASAPLPPERGRPLPGTR